MEWIIALVSVDSLIFVGYLILAFGWYKKILSVDGEQAEALRHLLFIFLLCGCSYIWTAVDLVWPGWRLLFIVKTVLLMMTWRFVLTKQFALSGVYDSLNELNRLKGEHERKDEMIAELHRSAREAREKDG